MNEWKVHEMDDHTLNGDGFKKKNECDNFGEHLLIIVGWLPEPE